MTHATGLQITFISEFPKLLYFTKRSISGFLCGTTVLLWLDSRLSAALHAYAFGWQTPLETLPWLRSRCSVISDHFYCGKAVLQGWAAAAGTFNSQASNWRTKKIHLKRRALYFIPFPHFIFILFYILKNIRHFLTPWREIYSLQPSRLYKSPHPTPPMLESKPIFPQSLSPLLNV